MPMLCPAPDIATLIDLGGSPELSLNTPVSGSTFAFAMIKGGGVTAPAGPRRSPLRTIVIAFLALTLICCGGAVGVAAWLFHRGATDTFGKVEFANRLAIPPLAPSTLDERGRRVFELRAGSGTHDFGSGHTAPTWGFNGAHLGPTLRASRGEQFVVNVRNTLQEDTSVHWHGMHLPAAMDGGPHQPVRAGGHWAPTWKIDQPAATLWYHPHPHGRTSDHVYRGLAGLFIVDDPGAAPDLPHHYGVDDVPVIVQAKDFDDDGLDDGGSLFSDLGVLGHDIVVNGTYAPYLNVTTSLLRLRVLNASNARVYHFRFSDNRLFSLIGTDGGLLERPVDVDRVPLAGGERAEIVVAMRPGERVVLRSHPPDLGGGIERFMGGDDRFDVLELRAAARLERSAALPAKLAAIDRLDPATATVTRQFRLSGHSINSQKIRMDRLDHVSTVDTTEVWEVTNGDGDVHSFHVHDVQFQVVSYNGGAPPARLSGWKDTISVHNGERYRLAMRFTDYTDPNTPYMYHCHVLAHEDSGMMGQFVVVRPGEVAGRVGSHPGGH